MQIKFGDETYALLVKHSKCEYGSTWYGDKMEPLQAQKFIREKGFYFQPHFHILNPRIIKRTQEAFVVISGKIQIDVYDKKGEILGSFEVCPGDMALIYKGGHSVTVLEECVVYEIKAGQYTHVSEDKEYL